MWVSLSGQTYKVSHVLGPPFFVILVSESCLAPSKSPNNEFYLNLIAFIYSHIYVRHCTFHLPFRTSRSKTFCVSGLSLWVGSSLSKSAEFQLSTSSRTGLAFSDKHTTHSRRPRATFFWFRNFTLGFDRPFQLSTSSRSG
jgi:hypothetical protein